MESEEASSRRFHSRRAAPTFLLLYSVAVAVLGMFECGYQTGVVNSPEEQVEDWIWMVYAERGYLFNRTVDGYTYTERGINAAARKLYFTIIVAAFPIGGMIGALPASSLADRIGRKRALLLADLVGVVGAALTGLCYVVVAPEVLVVGRFVAGIASGR